MKISISQLIIIQKVLKEFPWNTPRRIELISREISDLKRPEVDLMVELDGIKLPSDQEFSPTMENIVYICHNLPIVDVQLNHEGKKVLLPEETECLVCQVSRFRMDPRPANVRIYDINGVLNALYFHSRCSDCKRKYYYNFIEDTEKNTRQFRVNKKYFVIASGVGFTTDFLNKVSLDVGLGSVSFEHIAEIFNFQFGIIDSNMKLNKDIVEETWLIYRITMISKHVKWDRKIESGKYFCEKICMNQYDELKLAVDSKWLRHICDEVGCKDRAIICDGNEKLFRYCCSLPANKKKGEKGEINKIQRCINNPSRGNQNKKSNTLCQFHLTGKTHDVTTFDQIDYRPRTRNLTRNLVEKFVSNEGCKVETSLNKYSERTAGMFYVVRSCGIRLSNFEMFTSESLSMVFTSLIDLFGVSPSENDIKYVVYDRACDLSPYIERLAKEGNSIAENFKFLHYIVDIFHCEKHISPKCVIGSAECKFHPDLPEFSHIRKMNMEICEQTNHILNTYKHITRNMTYAKRLCFFKIIDNDFNERLEMKQKINSL